MKNLSLLSTVFFLMVLTSCKRSFQPIDYGKEACTHCKMTIMDKKFAAEIVDEKGKAFKFDDLVCLKDFIADKKLDETKLLLFVADYNNPSEFIDVKKALLLEGEQFKSPMSGNLAAFATEQTQTKWQQQTGAKNILWNSLK